MVRQYTTGTLLIAYHFSTIRNADLICVVCRPYCRAQLTRHLGGPGRLVSAGRFVDVATDADEYPTALIAI